MLDDKIPVPSMKQSGFSLVELMVALVLGLLITAAVTAMTVNSLKMSGDTLKSARLNQDLGAVMQIMVNDIRRAGYALCVDDPDASPPVDCHSPRQNLEYYWDEEEDINIVSSTCVLYSYNRNSDNVKNDDERQGFKLENNQIMMRTSCGTDDSYSAHATSCATDCSVGTWVDLTDPDIVTITEFEINSEDSKCHNVDEVISIRIKRGESATEFACNEMDHDSLQQGIVDAEGDWVWGELTQDLNRSMDESLKEYGIDNPDAVFPVTSVGVRHANILLSGVFQDPFVEAGSDYNEYPIRKSLDVSINVRNDRVYEVDAP